MTDWPPRLESRIVKGGHDSDGVYVWYTSLVYPERRRFRRWFVLANIILFICIDIYLLPVVVVWFYFRYVLFTSHHTWSIRSENVWSKCFKCVCGVAPLERMQRNGTIASRKNAFLLEICRRSPHAGGYACTRVYGGGAGGGGDSEGTISDSENSTSGDPDVEFQQDNGGNTVWRKNGTGEKGSLSTSTPKILLDSVDTSVDSQDGGGEDDLIDRASEGARQEDGLSGSVPQDHASAGSEVGIGGTPTRHPRDESPQNSPRSSPQSSPRNLKRGDGDKEDAGSESGCSSLHSPQRVFSPTEDETSPPGSPSPAISPRRFTSPTAQRSPPGSPTVSSPGSSRSGSVADGNEVEAGSTKRRFENTIFLNFYRTSELVLRLEHVADD